MANPANMRRFRCLPALPVLVLLASQSVGVEAPSPPVQPPVNSLEALEFFETRIRPVLAENCHKCHSQSAKQLEGGLYLDSREGILRGGDRGPVIVAGKPQKSLLIRAVQYLEEDLEMPPSGRLPNQVIVDLSRWIELGAPWPSAGGMATSCHEHLLRCQP